jgi:hypothetical protein
MMRLEKPAGDVTPRDRGRLRRGDRLASEAHYGNRGELLWGQDFLVGMPIPAGRLVRLNPQLFNPNPKQGYG